MSGGIQGRHAVVLAIGLVLAPTALASATLNTDTSQIPNEVGHGILGFEAKRSITIHNNGTAVEDARVPVVFDTAQEINDGDLEPDCSDLRFTPDTTPSRSLAFWLDPSACGDSDTTIWVEVPSIPASEDGPEAELTLFYGEPSMPAGPLDHAPERRSTGPTINVGSEQSLLGSSDTDGDAVSDTLEETLCGRPVENRLIGDSREKTGDCEVSGTDYSPTENETWLISPSLVHAGEDRDGDGIPAAVNVSYTNVTLNVTDTDPTDVRFGGTIEEALDPNDTDPSTPTTQRLCRILESPRGVTSLAPGWDTDADGVPETVWVTRARICAEETNITVDPSAKQTAPDLDPDGDDPAIPTAIETTTDPVSRNATFSPDHDGDRLPCRGFVGFVDVTFDRDAHEYTTNTWTQSVAYDADADCEDSNAPTHEPHLDLESDGIPLRTELFICERQLETTGLDGYCTDLDTNYHPPSSYFHAVAPQEQPIEP